MRGVTLAKGQRFTVWEFQLTRLMRGVTIGLGGILKDLHISTHTPHARRDAPFWNSSLIAS